MTTDNVDEQTWAAEKRAFVADHRDEVADRRDAIADQRDVTADERERLIDDREAQLDLRASRARSGGAEAGPANGEADRKAELAVRGQARVEREQRADDRATAKLERSEAAERRHSANPDTFLAQTFARLAGHLYESENVDQVLDRIVWSAVATIDGCDFASLTARQQSGFATVASTAPAASESDRAQYETDDGPCLDAVGGDAVHAKSFPDPRWPTLGARPVDFGVHSALSNPVEATSSAADGGLVGSLNSYGGSPHAFDDEAQEIGLLLATHASLAIRVVDEREALDELGRHLHRALESRDVIGQAKGILMERLHLTPEQAFDALRRSSQQLNVKLAQIAQAVSETGEFVEARVPKTDS